MPNLQIERVLLVAGAPNTGKSTQLRSMFRDPRFGSNGQIPVARKVAESYSLSPSRRLHLRLTSPHEAGETLTEFLDKIAAKTAFGRWCVASAIQVDAANKMPSLVDTVGALMQRLTPESVRVAVLVPDRHGQLLTSHQQLFDSLLKIANCEPFCIDARSRDANGLLLADTFDFA